MSGGKLERIQAPVKFYSKDKKYGFCKRPGQMDIYISDRELQKANIAHIKENDILEFDLVPVKDKGGRAVNIKVIRS